MRVVIPNCFNHMKIDTTCWQLISFITIPYLTKSVMNLQMKWLYNNLPAETSEMTCISHYFINEKVVANRRVTLAKTMQLSDVVKSTQFAYCILALSWAHVMLSNFIHANYVYWLCRLFTLFSIPANLNIRVGSQKFDWQKLKCSSVCTWPNC